MTMGYSTDNEITKIKDQIKTSQNKLLKQLSKFTKL